MNSIGSSGQCPTAFQTSSHTPYPSEPLRHEVLVMTQVQLNRIAQHALVDARSVDGVAKTHAVLPFTEKTRPLVVLRDERILTEPMLGLMRAKVFRRAINVGLASNPPTGA